VKGEVVIKGEEEEREGVTIRAVHKERVMKGTVTPLECHWDSLLKLIQLLWSENLLHLHREITK